jgi:hypothetical protein
VNTYLELKKKAQPVDDDCAEALYYLSYYKWRTINGKAEDYVNGPMVREVLTILREAIDIRPELGRWACED